MQTHGGENAEKAILASERDITISLRVDWNRDGQFDHVLSDLTPFVSNVTLDKALSGSTPEDLLLVEGNAAAELEATLGGEYRGLQLPAIFSPFNTQSPLYGLVLAGADIEYDIIVRSPLGQFVYPQFRGFVRTITPERGTNDVILTALDYAEILRSPVQLVPWAISEQHLGYGELESVSITSDWVIDSCLRLCDVSTTPYRPTFWEELNVEDWGLDGVQVYITGNGGYLPTVGWLDNLNADTFANPGHAMYAENAPQHAGAVGVEGPGPRGLNGLGDGISDVRQASSEGFLHYWALDRDKINPGGSHYVAFTLNRQSGLNLNNMDEVPLIEVCVGGHYYLYILLRQGQVRARRRYSTGTPSSVRDFQTDWMSIPSGDHIDIHAAWDNTEETGGRIWIGARVSGTSTWIVEQGNWSTATGDPVVDPDDDNYLKGRVKIGQAVGMSDIVYATRNVYSASLSLLEQSTVRKAKYAAVVDRGINRLGFMPYREARDAWDIICDVAGAEFGSVFFDENGVFRFWNWDRMLEKQKYPVRTFTLDEIEGLNLTTSLDSVRNVITVQATSKRAVFGNVWASDDLEEFVVPPGSWIEKKIWVDDILSPIPFRLGHDSDDLNQWRWEGIGTRGWYVWDADKIHHGYVISFWSPSRQRWEEHSEWEGGFAIDQYFAGDGFLTVRMGSSWDVPVRPATAQFTYDPQHPDAKNGYRDVGGEEPAYHIGGTYIKDYGDVSVFSRSRESMLKYGARNLELKGDWYHDTTVMPDLNGTYPVIDRIMRRVEEPLPTTDAITIAGDPRLQLGDAIVVTDPSGLGDEMPMQILGINREWDIEGGLTDTLTVQMYRLVHDRPPSHVDAGPDVYDWPVGQTFVRQGSYNPGDDTAVELSWKVIAGTSFVNQVVDFGDTLEFPVTEPGWWRFQFIVSTNFGTASDIFELHTVGSEQNQVPAHVGEALWIGGDPGKNHFKIDIGLGNTGGTDDLTLEQSDIEAGEDYPGRFFLTQHPVEGPVVEYRMNAGASRTTSGTSYPRSEHREVAQDGDDNFGWDGAGTHYMKWRAGIVEFAPTRSWICIGQIHDANMDKVRIQTEGNGNTGLDLVVRWNPTEDDDGEQRTPLIEDGYNLGDFHDFEIRVVDDILFIYIDGELKFQSPQEMNIEGGYFKFGNYLQVSPDRQPGADPDEEGAVQVVAGSVEVWHDGYPDPTEPVWTGGDGGGVPGGGTESFGNNSGGSGSTSSGIAKKKVSLAKANGTGTVTSLTVRGRMEQSGATTQLRGVIYSDDNGAPGDLLAQTDPIIISSSSMQEWTANFPSNQQIQVTQGTDYWIGVHWDAVSGGGGWAIARDTQTGVAPVNEDSFGDGPSDPFDQSGEVKWEAGPIDCWVNYTTGETFAMLMSAPVNSKPVEPDGPTLGPAPALPPTRPVRDAAEMPVVPPAEEPIVPARPSDEPPPASA